MRCFHPYKIIGGLLLLLLGASAWLHISGRTIEADFYLKVFSAFGVFCAVLFALYGEAIKSFVDRIDLQIELGERSNNFLDLHPADTGPVSVFCHHLRVINKTPYRPVLNCRVWLVRIQDEVDNTFKEQFTFAVPRLMKWAPAEFSPEVRSFSEDQVFDFGYTYIGQDTFDVTYHNAQGGVFKGACLAGHRRRYIFRITADNYIRSKLHTVEVRVLKTDARTEWPYRIRTDIDVIT